MAGCEAVTELQTVRSRSEVMTTMSGFVKNRDNTKRQIISKLKHLRDVFSSSPFFQTHEVGLWNQLIAEGTIQHNTLLGYTVYN